ncbi:MAG: ABC transporter ATP-binding protein [Desulfobacterales bacterium]
MIEQVNSEQILTARSIVHRYQGASRPSVDNLSLSIFRGEILGLLGPNGAGKTTFISILSTLLKPTEGDVSICGIDIIKYPNRVRSLLGFVPQNIAVYSDLTGRENMLYYGKLYGLRGKKLETKISRLLEMLGLKEKADMRTHIYSGGMKRRLNIGLGILHNPKILFLDEPTVGIDAQSRNMILEKLSLMKKSGTAMIYTTHYMEEAEILCDRIIILNEGRNIAEGNPSQMINQAEGCRNLGDLFLSLTGEQLRD